MSDPPKVASDSWRCRWVCPPPEPLGDEDARSLLSVVSRAASIAESVRAVDCVGLEIRAAYYLESGQPAQTSLNDNDYWDKKCRALFLRPAIEPALISYWDRVTSLDLDEVKAQKMVSAITAKEQVFRRGESTGRSIYGSVGFESLDRAHDWLKRLKEAQRQPEFASFMPMYTFATVIMSHPFGDGNGRLARAMTQASLGNLAGWRFPILALAPSFYRRAETLGRTLDELTIQGNWRPYIKVFVEILADAIDLTRRSLAL